MMEKERKEQINKIIQQFREAQHLYAEILYFEMLKHTNFYNKDELLKKCLKLNRIVKKTMGFDLIEKWSEIYYTEQEKEKPS